MASRETFEETFEGRKPEATLDESWKKISRIHDVYLRN